jgi:4-hydroxy-tetrahydrodipicolinate reductase
MIKIVICGAGGRMGNEIISAALDSDDISVVAGVELQKHPSVGKHICGVAIVDDIAAGVRNCDCVVDFTQHAAAVETLEKIKDSKKPFVTGTTGFTEREQKTIKALSKCVPVFWAPNMSVGVNHLYRLVDSTLDALSDFDIEVIETHHRAKKDAPSGTAKHIARIIKDKKAQSDMVHGREGHTGERSTDEVCIHAVRGGDVVGEHRVLFLGDGEFLELRHHATSRRCFAAGTLAAVRFIIDRPPGLYTMGHLLK